MSTHIKDDDKGRAGRPARLTDVARRAEVSRATAARALGGYGPVGEETRERVARAARELNYSANVVARAMRAGNTRTIGVVIADISNSFFSSAVRAIIDTAATAGYHTLVVNTDDDLAREIDAVRVLTQKRVDGLIVVPSSRTQVGHLAPGPGQLKPMVLLDRRVEGLDAVSACTDDRGGARAAVELFLDCGHEHIGLLFATVAATRPQQAQPASVVSTVLDRVAGALDALTGKNLPAPQIWYSRSDVATSRVAARQILASWPRPTAILATNEEMALGVLAACGDLGLRVGAEVSLISFDDSPWANAIWPAVSVIRRPVHELGRAAVLALIQKMSGLASPGSIELPTELIERASVARLR